MAEFTSQSRSIPASRLLRATDGRPIIIRRAELAEIIDLRHRILRQGLPRQEAIFAGDQSSDTLHVGAFLDESAVGCASLHRNEWESAPAWQLRGMATAAEVRRAGVGRAMLQLLESLAASAGPVRQLWCNARVPAESFYHRVGWRTVSEVFEIPTAGPHVRMTRRLAAD